MGLLAYHILSTIHNITRIRKSTATTNYNNLLAVDVWCVDSLCYPRAGGDVWLRLLSLPSRDPTHGPPSVTRRCRELPYLRKVLELQGCQAENQAIKHLPQHSVQQQASRDWIWPRQPRV